MLALSDIIDFLLTLLRDPQVQAAFEQNPQAALEEAGLDGVTGQDVRDAQLLLADSGAVRSDGDGPSGARGSDPVQEITYTTQHFHVSEDVSENVIGDITTSVVTIDDRDTIVIQDSFNSDDDVTVIDDSFNEVADIDITDIDITDIDIDAEDSFNTTEDNDVTAIQDNDTTVEDNDVIDIEDNDTIVDIDAPAESDTGTGTEPDPETDTGTDAETDAEDPQPEPEPEDEPETEPEPEPEPDASADAAVV